jgi:hypothetical protein
MRRKEIVFLGACLLVLALAVSPVPTLATIGDVGTGTDANGVSYQREWLDGNWSEFYSIGGSYWAIWIEEGTADTPGTETGNYYTYANLVDGDTTAYDWYSKIGGVVKEQNWISNTATGYYDESYYYNALKLSGPADAYLEEYDKTIDPLSGTNDYSYYKEVDFNGNHVGWDDWYYSTTDSYYAGTGEGSKDTELYNSIDGIWDVNDYSYNSLTGWYTLENDSYRDTDKDGNWYNNYYTQYFEDYEATDGGLYTTQYIYDYSKVVYSAATSYYREYDVNNFTGDYYEAIDARTDTDGDGSFNDYGAVGTAGAYRSYYEASLDTNDGYLYKNSRVWNSISDVYTQDYYEEYLGTGYNETVTRYQWDADKDGSYSDDYYYYAENYNNYYGENYQNFYNYDYLTDRTGDGTPDASYYSFYSDANPVSGYLYTETNYQYDTDKDGSWGDYTSGGAYYSYAYEYYDPSDGSYEKEMSVYTPPSADNTVLFSYTGEYDEAQGMYTYSEKWNYIDADFDKNLYDYGDGGAYRYYTYAETDPNSEYLDYYYEEVTWDPWSNVYMKTYSDAEPGVNGEVFYLDAYAEIGLDTDDNGNYFDNYYGYAETYNDQYDGNGYTYNENYYWDYDNGIYQYNYAESYASGQAYTEYRYAKDTDGDGVIETGAGDDFWNYEETNFDATDNDFTTYAWISDDYYDARGAFWWSQVNTNKNADSGDNWTFAQTANLGGYALTTSGTFSGGDIGSISGTQLYSQGLIGQRGQTWDATVSATWGDAMSGSGSYSYSGGDSGTWTIALWDTNGDTDYYNTHPFYPGGSPASLSWEVRSNTWSETEGVWQYAGYELDDSDTGNYFFYQKAMSPNGDQATWDTRDGATGNYNELVFEYASGAATPSFGSSEWWYGTGYPGGTPYAHYLYSGAANAWYLYYADPYPSI